MVTFFVKTQKVLAKLMVFLNFLGFGPAWVGRCTRGAKNVNPLIENRTTTLMVWSAINFQKIPSERTRRFQEKSMHFASTLCASKKKVCISLVPCAPRKIGRAQGTSEMVTFFVKTQKVLAKLMVLVRAGSARAACADPPVVDSVSYLLTS